MCSIMFVKNGRRGNNNTGNMFPILAQAFTRLLCPSSIVNQIDFVLLFAIKAK